MSCPINNYFNYCSNIFSRLLSIRYCQYTWFVDSLSVSELSSLKLYGYLELKRCFDKSSQWKNIYHKSFSCRTKLIYIGRIMITIILIFVGIIMWSQLNMSSDCVCLLVYVIIIDVLVVFSVIFSQHYRILLQYRIVL